jgi:hypothetical protein
MRCAHLVLSRCAGGRFIPAISRSAGPLTLLSRPGLSKKRSRPSPQPSTITHVQELQLLGLFVLTERHRRPLTEIRAAAAALLSGVSGAPDLRDLVGNAIFGSAPADQLLAELEITVEPPT